MNESRPVSPNITLEAFLMVCVFPFQLVIGLTGNACNLIVLLSRGMRSKTNLLLAMMAFADMLLLIFMVPHSLMFNAILTRNVNFRHFIVYAMPHLAGICNLCSFVSAWLVVVVCGERVMAVMFPLQARLFWTRKTLIRICAIIWVFAIILSMHSHITHRVETVTLNISTIAEDGVRKYRIKNTLQAVLRKGMLSYWQLAVSLDILFLVFLPVLLVIAANAILINCLRRQHIAHIKSQKRATTIVFTIATAFTLCQTPSAIVYIWEMIKRGNGSQPLFRTLATLSNSTVVTGKASNFFLFCTWSSHFRKQFLLILARRTPSLFHFLQRIIPAIRDTLPAQQITYYQQRSHKSMCPTIDYDALHPKPLRHHRSLPLNIRFPQANDDVIPERIIQEVRQRDGSRRMGRAAPFKGFFANYRVGGSRTNKDSDLDDGFAKSCISQARYSDFVTDEL